MIGALEDDPGVKVASLTRWLAAAVPQCRCAAGIAAVTPRLLLQDMLDRTAEVLDLTPSSLAGFDAEPVTRTGELL